ncbi:MAG: universal stress protein [Desulfobacterales bacterium]|nr:universal stress protein [Desulfobacterales bacterium]
MFKTILAATDSVEKCDTAILAAAEIAAQNNCELNILHVLESSYSGFYRQFVKHFESGEEIVSSEDYCKAVKEKILNACTHTLRKDLGYQIKVTTGFPWEEILRWSRKIRSDLIILGPHSTSADERGLTRHSGTLGSTVEGVIKHERCPVMVVGRPLTEGILKFKKIMVCVNFSASCELALQFAVKMAGKYGSKIFVFHMAAMPSSRRYPQEELEAEIDVFKQKIEVFTRDIPESVEFEYGVWEGSSPYVEILKYAREKNIDLISMGSHTKEKETRWYIGSAVEQVSSRSFCPVVIITDPRAVLRFES